MTDFYYRIQTAEGADFGLILGKHTSYSAAIAAQNKDNKIHDFNCVQLLESAEKLKTGEHYPEKAREHLAQERHNLGISLMSQVFRARESNDDTNLLSYRIEAHNWTLESLEEEFGELARQEMDKQAAVNQKHAERQARITAVENELSAQRSDFNYRFPAVAGIQAGRQYFTAQIPYRALVRLFRFDEEDVVPAELRAQRQLNETRARKIGQYVNSNRADYVLPSLTASCDCSMHFEALDAAGHLGMLNISMDAILLINDGQHRRKGIELALQQDRSLANETVAVTIFYDQGLKKSQQMFADINMNAVKPSGAINMVYDHRNEFSAWIMGLLDKMPRIKARIELETSSVGAKSYKLWSIVAFKKAVIALTSHTEKSFSNADQAARDSSTDMVLNFFKALEHLPNWTAMIDNKISAYEVRETFLIGHAVFLEALAGATNLLIQQKSDNTWATLEKLSEISVAKADPRWQGRCVVAGRMNKTAFGVKSTAAEIATHLDIPLPPEMRELHEQTDTQAA